MNRKNAFLAAILFVLTLSGMYIFISHSTRFCVAQIDIQGNHKASEKEILKEAGVELGTNIFRLDLSKIQDRIRGDQRIKEVQVKRRLPDRLLIEVEEKKPALWMNLPEGLYGLSQDGEIIPLEKKDFHRDLPIVSGLPSPSLPGKRGQSVAPYEKWPDVKARLALDFCNALLGEDSSFGEIISEISLQDETDLVLYLIPQAIRVNAGKGSYKKKFRRLKAILNREEETGLLTYIDLRFKDQVVLRKSPPGLVTSGSQEEGPRSAQKKRKGFGGKENL
jgi:cell division protein FtsQ